MVVFQMLGKGEGEAESVLLEVIERTNDRATEFTHTHAHAPSHIFSHSFTPSLTHSHAHTYVHTHTHLHSLTFFGLVEQIAAVVVHYLSDDRLEGLRAHANVVAESVLEVVSQNAPLAVGDAAQLTVQAALDGALHATAQAHRFVPTGAATPFDPFSTVPTTTAPVSTVPPSSSSST